MQNNELVFTIPFIKTNHIPEGFCDTKQELSDFDLLGSFLRRDTIEGDKTLQQLVSFIIVRNPIKKKFFIGKRISGEERLLNCWSGFGGHTDIIDCCLNTISIIESCAKRELEEELSFNLYKKDTLSTAFNYIGTVRDTMSETGDHLGFVFLLDVKSCSVKETDKIEGKWFSYHDILMKFSMLDNWTQYVIEYLYKTTDLKKYLKQKS